MEESPREPGQGSWGSLTVRSGSGVSQDGGGEWVRYTPASLSTCSSVGVVLKMWLRPVVVSYLHATVRNRKTKSALLRHGRRNRGLRSGRVPYGSYRRNHYRRQTYLTYRVHTHSHPSRSRRVGRSGRGSRSCRR